MDYHFALTTSTGQLYRAYGQAQMCIKTTPYDITHLNNIGLVNGIIKFHKNSEIYGQVVWELQDFHICLPVSHASESDDLYIILLHYRNGQYRKLANPVHFTQFFIPHEYFTDEMMNRYPQLAPNNLFTKKICKEMVKENPEDIFNIPTQFAEKDMLNLGELWWDLLCGTYSRFRKANMEKLFPTHEDWELAIKHDSDARIFMPYRFKKNIEM